MKATEFLHKAASLLEERGKQYDQPQGERSMGKAVTAFNAITSRNLSEAEGWLLLQVLKDVRQWQNPGRYHADSAEDCVSYSALKAEALANAELAKHGLPTDWKIGPIPTDTLVMPQWTLKTEEPAASIDDESPRAQAIGQNGNTGEHYDFGKPDWKDAPEWATNLCRAGMGRHLIWTDFEQYTYCSGQYDGKVFKMFDPIAYKRADMTDIEARPCQ